MGASQGRPHERDLPMRRQEREEWIIELLESEDIKGLKRFIAKETNQTYLHTTDEDRHTTLYHQSQHGDQIAQRKEKGLTDIPSLDDDENSQSVSSTSTSFHLPDIDPTLLIGSNVADGYICGICLLLIRGAVILPCRHEYCLSCVDNIRESFSTRNDSSVELCGERVCPYCRTKFLPTDVRPSFETRRRLQQLELHCPNHSMHGCQWIGTVDKLPHHLTILCDYESITCQRCGKKLNREQSKYHECAVDAMVDFESKSKKITNRSTQSASSSSSSLSSSAPAFVSSSLFYPLTYSSPLNAYCLRVGDSFTILHQSVVMSSPSFIRSLLIEGCNPNIRSRGSLDISTHHQSPDEMDAVFYSNSTDVLIRSHRRSLEVKRYTDRTEKYLNSNIKYREIGFTPLMLAVIFAADDVVCEVCQLLIAFGADLNSTTTYSNWSTIMFAATRRHPLLYSTLCDYGADISMRNTEGHHALDVAHVWGGRKCVEMVENEAARRSKMRYELEQILGGRVQMAQVCIELTQQYAGLSEMK